MGSNAVFCRRHTLRGRNDHIINNVQEARTVEHRHHPLHFVALSAMGHKAILESVHRHYKDQTLVDCGHAAARWGRIGRSCLHHPCRMVASRHPVLFLADGFFERHSRHSCRRFLHAGARPAPAGVVCRHTIDILPHSHHLRTRRPGDDCRQPGSAHPEREILVEPDVLLHGGLVHCPLALPQLGPAATYRRQRQGQDGGRQADKRTG